VRMHRSNPTCAPLIAVWESSISNAIVNAHIAIGNILLRYRIGDR
jgi:hypothetical protein